MYQTSLIPTSSGIRLHPEIFEILFKHKKEISRKLSDIIGWHFIDHVAITLINPNLELLIFSTTPSVEFNLLAQGLWRYDLSFNPQSYKNNKILFWDKTYAFDFKYEIKKLKEADHHFSTGFSLLKKINGFNIIYSFATRHNRPEIHKFYQDLRLELLALGDYGYKQLFPIYEQHSKITPPMIDAHCMKRLRLVVNNP